MKYIITTLLLGIAAASVWYFYSMQGGLSSQEDVGTMPAVTGPLTKEYRNDPYRFSLTMPEDFAAQEFPLDESGIQTILFQNANAEGIQIVISPFDCVPPEPCAEEDEGLTVLTKERIQQDVPDMKITDEQPVEIGASHKGLAFKSDNEAFCAPPEPCAEGGGGASREVWFVFRGNLYQISTYERLDPLLKAIFQTWQFN